jgi:hypothetical protein
MFLSVFDVFKIGIGPSSSHTMGPMTAAGRFLDQMRAHPAKAELAAVRVGLYGSLAFTGKGHATDRAVAIGLLGHLPSTLDIDKAERDLEALKATATLRPKGLPPLAFQIQGLYRVFEIDHEERPGGGMGLDASPLRQAALRTPATNAAVEASLSFS